MHIDKIAVGPTHPRRSTSSSKCRWVELKGWGEPEEAHRLILEAVRRG
jgi:hypothetical protein